MMTSNNQFKISHAHKGYELQQQCIGIVLYIEMKYAVLFVLSMTPIWINGSLETRYCQQKLYIIENHCW